MDRFDGGANGHQLGNFLVKGVLKLVDGLGEIGAGAELPDQLERRAHLADRRDLQHLGIIEVQHALVAVFGQERLQHRAGLRAVFCEDVALAHVVGPLAPGQRGLVESDVADQVERIEILADLVQQMLERQSLAFQLLNDQLLALGFFPTPQKAVEAGEALAQRFLGKIPQAFGHQTATLVKILDALGDDRHRNAIDIDFLPMAAAGRERDVRRLAINDDLLVGWRRRHRILVRGDRGLVLGRGDRIVVAGLVNLHRLAVELRIGEVVGGAAKIHQREVELLGVFMHAGAAADDLLELRHRPHGAVEHDQPAGLRVDAGRQQPRRGDDHRVRAFRINEIAELRLAFGVAAGDAHDIAVVHVAKILVLIDQRLAHACRVFLINAEDDRFLEAVAAGFEEIADFGSHQLGAILEHQRAVEILLIVDAVFDRVAVTIEGANFGTIAGDVPVDMDLADLVGGEKAIPDAFAQRVGINRIAEIVDVGNVFRFLGRGRQADLRRRAEIIEDLTPGGILGGTPAMALVDNNQIEEAW